MFTGSKSTIKKNGSEKRTPIAGTTRSGTRPKKNPIRQKRGSTNSYATSGNSNILESETAKLKANEAKAARKTETASEPVEPSAASTPNEITPIAETESNVPNVPAKPAESIDSNDQATEEARTQARESLGTLGLVEQDHAWWTKQTYEDAQKLKEQDAALSASISPSKFWSGDGRDQIEALLELRQRIQIDLDAKSSNPEVEKHLNILGQPIGKLPEIAKLDDMARELLIEKGLEEKGANIWQLKEEAELQNLKDIESKSTAKMPAEFNAAQQQLFDFKMRQYLELTRKEFQSLLKKGRDLGRANDAALGLYHGGKRPGDETLERFYFLGYHHPGINTTALTPQKKSSKPFMQEAREASWKRLQNTPEWKDASNEGSEANKLQRRIDKKYNKLHNDTEVEIALKVVGGKLPLEIEK